MKIEGVETMEETGTVAFPRRNLTIPIHALSPRFELDLARQLPMPRPPETYARDKDGDILRGKGGKPQRIVDENDAAYLAKKQEHDVLVLVAVIYHGTEQGGPVSWETDEALLVSKPADFYRGLFAELTDMKFRQGDIIKWWASIQKLSGLSEEEVEAAAASFPKPE